MHISKPPQVPHPTPSSLQGLVLEVPSPSTSTSTMNYLPFSNPISTPPSSPLLDDHIGGESCVDLKSFDEVAFSPVSETNILFDRRNRKVTPERQCSFVDRRQRYVKEYPPLIPLLARTENLPSRMPWVLRRHYTDDGRLILREERVKHHEYFRAHRENGRLTLQLIPLDDDVSYPPLPLVDQPEEGEDIDLEMDDTKEDYKLDTGIDIGIGIGIGIEGDKDNGETNTDIEDMIRDIHIGNDSYSDDDDIDKHEECGNGGLVGEEVIAKLSTRSISPGNGGSPVAGVGKCLNINSMVRVSGSGIFGMQVPALRPVHS